MKVTAVALGSRGDVQPIVALAHAVRAAGHEISIAASSDAARLIADHGFTHVDVGFSVDAEMQTPVGRQWLTASGGNPFREMTYLRRFYEQCGDRIAEALLALRGTAELFISGLLSADAVASIARYDRVAHAIALFAPFHPTRSGAAGIASRGTTSSLANLVISQISLRTFAGVVTRAGGRIVRERLGMAEPGAKGFVHTLATTPTVLAVSPILTPRPADWPETAQVTGPWVLPPDQNFTPTPGLAEFLTGGPPPVYIGFGSMVVENPAQLIELAERVSRLTGTRVIVSGIGQEGMLADDLVAIGPTPHSWLFPRLSGVVHHGGSGTTHAALLAGVPQLIVPHIGDQPYWGRRTHEVGIAAPPIPLHQLTAERLADGVRRLRGSSQLRERALGLAAASSKHDPASAAVAQLVGRG